MTDAKFEKLTRSSKPLYGPRKLLLFGFPAAAQSKFAAVLELAGIADVPVVWVSSEQAETTIAHLLNLAAGTGAGVASRLPRAVLAAGITEVELHRLMTVCRKTGMHPALWAALTPTSEQWPARRLLEELSAERAAMRAKQR
jgi:hypothetical protein